MNESEYSGQFQKGSFNGYGEFKEPWGTFAGQWKDDVKHGYGELKFNDGRIMRGEFYDEDNFEGITIYENCEGIFECKFVNGER